MSDETERGRTVRRIAEKISKLIKLAEDQAGTPEGDLAAGQARRLMDAHTIGADELAAVGDPPLQKVITIKGHTWRAFLACSIARYAGAFALFGRTSVCFYGRTSTVEIAEYLFRAVEQGIDSRCEEYMGRVVAMWPQRTGRPIGRGETTEVRNAFGRGAYHAIRVRLAAMMAQEETAAPAEHSTAMVRVSEAAAMANEHISDIKARDLTGTWSKAGVAAGNAIPLNVAIGEQPARRQIERAP